MRAGRVSVVPPMAATVSSVNHDAADHRLDVEHHPYLHRLVFAVTRTAMVASQLGYNAGIRIGGGDRCICFIVAAYKTGTAPLLNG